MATDEALLRCFDPAASLPILRLYGWNPPALSLGRFQDAATVLDLPRCANEGVAVVRRITGGGVIYHADELTYAIVCAPHHIPPAASIKDSFRVLTGFLLDFYRHCGIEAGYACDAAPAGTLLGERTHFCFAGRETFDILANGHKIGGNAQRRTKGIIFQHGSIPLVNRAATGVSYLRDKAPEQAADTVSLAECGVTAERSVLSQELLTAFSERFGVLVREDALSEREQALRAELLAGRYASERWNLEGGGE